MAPSGIVTGVDIEWLACDDMGAAAGAVAAADGAVAVAVEACAACDGASAAAAAGEDTEALTAPVAVREPDAQAPNNGKVASAIVAPHAWEKFNLGIVPWRDPSVEQTLNGVLRALRRWSVITSTRCGRHVLLTAVAHR